MYAVTSMPLVRRTRATFRSAEFGFFGVVVYTRVQTPRRWGEPFNAGVLVFSTLSSRPLRTSWLIVGMGGLDLLPALGRASDVLLCWLRLRCRSCPGADLIVVGSHRPAHAVGRVALPRPADEGRTGLRRPSRLGAATSQPWPSSSTRRPEGHPGAPRTGAGPGHPGHSSPQYPRPGGRSKPGP